VGRGAVRSGLEWCGGAGQGEYLLKGGYQINEVWFGRVWPGEVRRGRVRRGPVRQGNELPILELKDGKVGPGKAWPGEVRHGTVWLGKAGKQNINKGGRYGYNKETPSMEKRI
jgi:hypothetical protein